MKQLVFSITVLCLFTFISSHAQTNATEVAKPTIFKDIVIQTDTAQGIVVLKQDPRIEELVFAKKQNDAKNAVYTTTMGYRVQIFSSNKQQTAKTEAYKIEELAKEKAPQFASYVAYFSPFWKVRVGDCITSEEAQKVKEELAKVLPELKKEMYIVRDQVQIPE